MKKNIVIIVSIVVLLILMGVMVVFGIKKENKKITSIKTMYFTYTGGYSMNAYTRYELEKRENGYFVKIKPNGIPEEQTQEAKLKDTDIEKIIKVLNDNKVIKWNNFHESDKYVLDGDSFSFDLTTEDELHINASGYMRWPDNYGTVKSTLVEIIDAYYNYEEKVYE